MIWGSGDLAPWGAIKYFCDNMARSLIPLSEQIHVSELSVTCKVKRLVPKNSGYVDPIYMNGLIKQCDFSEMY